MPFFNDSFGKKIICHQNDLAYFIFAKTISGHLIASCKRSLLPHASVYEESILFNMSMFSMALAYVHVQLQLQAKYINILKLFLLFLLSSIIFQVGEP